jgi:hypothetical protein
MRIQVLPNIGPPTMADTFCGARWLDVVVDFKS